MIIKKNTIITKSYGYKWPINSINQKQWSCQQSLDNSNLSLYTTADLKEKAENTAKRETGEAI